MKSHISKYMTVSAVALALLLGAGLATAQPIKFLSTGVGKDERVANAKYSLLLMFAEAKGPYVANVAVSIKDAQGKEILATTSQGPWLFVALPAGDYRVVATRQNGARTGAAVTVAAEGQQILRLTW